MRDPSLPSSSRRTSSSRRISSSSSNVPYSSRSTSRGHDSDSDSDLDHVVDRAIAKCGAPQLPRVAKLAKKPPPSATAVAPRRRHTQPPHIWPPPTGTDQHFALPRKASHAAQSSEGTDNWVDDVYARTRMRRQALQVRP